MLAADSVQGLVGLAVAVTLALLLAYLLRPRRRQVEVPFGGLWQRVLQRRDARNLGRRWQRWLSLLLMLVLAGLLWAALAEPVLRPQRAAAGQKRWSTVLVVDRSASMATRDGKATTTAPATRLQEAQRRLAEVVGTAAEDEDFLLLAASGHTDVVAGWGSDRTALLAAAQAIEPRQGGLDRSAAIDTATQMLQGRRGGRIVWVTDGGQGLAEAATAVVEVQQLWVGPAAALPPRQLPLAATPAVMADLAIVDARLRAEADDPDRGVLTVRVRNDSGHAIDARLVVASAADAQLPQHFREDRALRRIVEIRLPAGESLQRLEGLELADGRFGVRVEARAASWQDIAPWNDWGFAVLGSQRRLKVLRVGAPNRFLDGALAAIGRVDTIAIPPQAYQPQAWRAADRSRHGIDLAVFDQAAMSPPEGMPALTLALHPPADVTAAGTLLSGPEVLVRAGDHPAMRNVSFQDTNFDQVRALRTGPLDVTLAAATLGGGRSAAVMVARHGTVRRIEWGIDLMQTDLVGRYALPILLANAVAYLVGEEDGAASPLELGRPWAVETAGGAGRWTYLEPGHPPRAARWSAGQLLASSEVHGMHVWRSQEGREEVHPSVLPATERAAVVRAADAPFVPRPRPTALHDHATERPRWVSWLAVAAALIALEWLLYLRRRTA